MSWICSNGLRRDGTGKSGLRLIASAGWCQHFRHRPVVPLAKQQAGSQETGKPQVKEAQEPTSSPPGSTKGEKGRNKKEGE